MDHCTVTLVEFSTDTKLLEFHSAEMWSAMTLATLVNCSELSTLYAALDDKEKPTASTNMPGSIPVMRIGVLAAVATKVKLVVCQLVLLPKKAGWATPFNFTCTSASPAAMDGALV